MQNQENSYEQNNSTWAEIKKVVQNKLKQDFYAEAIEILNSFIAKNPKELGAIKYMAELLSIHPDQEVLDASLRLFQHLTKSQPASDYYYLQTANLQIKLDQVQQAKESILNAVYFNPENSEAIEIYDSLFPNLLSSEETKNLKNTIALYTGHPFLKKLPKLSEYLEQALGGSEYMFLSLAKLLAAEGHEVRIYANFGPDSLSKTDKLSYHDLRTFPIDQQRYEFKATIISRFYEALSHKNISKNKLLWLHDIVSSDYSEEYQKAYSNSDNFICLSEYQSKNYEKSCDISHSHFTQIPNFFEANLFTQNLPIEQRKQQIIYSSRPGRGLDIALSVYKKLLLDKPELKMLICSYSDKIRLEDDPEIAPYLDEINFLKVRVAQLTKRDLVAELSKSLLLVYPNTSQLETSCLAAIEAMAAGTPVITSNKGCLAETVPDQVAGFVIDVKDVKPEKNQFEKEQYINLLYQKAKLSLENQELWKKLSQQAREYAFNKYEAQIVLKKWLSLLQVN